jgi:hypothetical protein
VEPTTSYTISVALRHNTRLKREKVELHKEIEEELERTKRIKEDMKGRLKRDNNKLNEQLEELIDSVYEVYPEGFSSMPERLENIMTKILIRIEDGEHEWQLKEL